jgi:acyl carrier protein phosphodiesterase
MDLLIPKKPALPAKPMSWWNEELEDMKSRLKKLDINKNKTQEGKQAYQELKNEFKKAIKPPRGIVAKLLLSSRINKRM